MKTFLRRFDYLSFAATCALVAIGTVAIWSAGNARPEAVFHSMWMDNLVMALFGFAKKAASGFLGAAEEHK